MSNITFKQYPYKVTLWQGEKYLKCDRFCILADSKKHANKICQYMAQHFHCVIEDDEVFKTKTIKNMNHSILKLANHDPAKLYDLQIKEVDKIKKLRDEGVKY